MPRALRRATRRSGTLRSAKDTDMVTPIGIEVKPTRSVTVESVSIAVVRRNAPAMLADARGTDARVTTRYSCGRRDSNPHSEELVPKTSASANSATPARPHSRRAGGLRRGWHGRLVRMITSSINDGMGYNDLNQRLLRERIVFLGSQVDQETANTICVGMAASMGQFLLCAGAPGKRFSLPHSRILMRQPSAGGMQGQASDIAIQAEQIVYMKRMLAERIAFHTGQPLERIEADSDRDRWFTAQEAVEYGFIDAVIDRSAIRQGA